jgi:hypothetical protein
MVTGMSDWDERLLRAVRAAANRSSSAHRGFVEVDDLQQEGYMWILKHAEKANGWLEDGRDGIRLLQHSLYQHMHQYTMRQRYLKDGTKPGDYYWYQLAVLEELLPDALHDEPLYGSQSSDINHGYRSHKPISEGGDRMAMIADVRAAFSSLPAEERLLIAVKFGEGEPVPDSKLAAMYATSPSSVSRMVRKALKRMAGSLGAEPVVKRRVMSNAQAQHETKEQE